MMTTETKNKLSAIFAAHRNAKKDALIPILQETQAALGFLPGDAMREIAGFLGVTPGSVFGVASFYAQFRFAPTGKNRITVCHGTACHVRGGTRILEEVENLLKIKEGHMTPDGEYSIEEAACFGSCALAPVMVINDRVYGRMTTAKVREILGKKE
jgi:NADH-quinone oxidoreductase subunit E